MQLSQVIVDVEDDEVFKTNFLLFKKISLNYRDIVVLDPLSSKFQWVKELFLNHNNLRDLDGIQQFKNLEVLSLKSNHIDSLKGLEYIHNKFAIKVIVKKTIILQSLNFLRNPVASDFNCSFKYLQRQFVNLRELNETLTCLTEHLSITNRPMSRSKHLITEIKQHLDKENHQPNRSSRPPKLPSEDSSLVPSIQTTAKFASTKQKYRSIPMLAPKPPTILEDSFAEFHPRAPKPQTMQSLNLSCISNGRKSVHQTTKFVDTSLNMSKQSFALMNSDSKGNKTIIDNNDVSMSFQNRLDYHIQEIDDDLTILANVFYDRSMKIKVLKSFMLLRRPTTNSSLVNYDNERQLTETMKQSLFQDSASKLKTGDEFFAAEFHQTYVKIKVFAYLKGLIVSKCNRLSLLHKYASMKKLSLNSSRENSRTYRRGDNMNMPLSRRT